MYKKTLPLYNLEETVVLPLVRKTIQDLMIVLGITKDSIIENHLMTEDVKNKNFNISSGNRRTTLLSTTKIEMSYSEESNVEGSSSVDVVNGGNTPFLFYENNFNFSVKTLPSKITIIMKLKSKNKSEVTRAKNSMNSLWISGNDVLTHEAKVKYYPDKFVIDWFSSLNKLFNTKFNGELHITKFLNLFASKDLKVVVPSTGDYDFAALAIETKIGNMLGRFVNIKGNKVEYDNDKGYYSSDVEYTIEYQKPYEIICLYEPVINNVVIDDKFLIPTSITDDMYYGMTDCNSSGDMLGIMKTIKGLVRPKQKFINIPHFDIYTKTSQIGETIMSVLTVVDKDDDVLFDLTDLGDVHISPLFIDYIKREGNKVFIPYGSLLYLELQANGTQQNNNIYIDGNNLKIKKVDNTARYRVIINVMLDVTEIPKSAFNNMRFSFKELNNRRFVTNRKVTKCLQKLGIPDDVMNSLEDIISLKDDDLNLHMENVKNGLTVLTNTIAELIKKTKSGKVYLSNVPLPIPNSNKHKDRYNDIRNHWRWQDLPELTPNTDMVSNITYENNVRHTVYKSSGVNIEMLETAKYLIIDIISKNIRVIYNDDIGIILNDSFIFIINKEKKVYSLTDSKRFTDIFVSHMIRLSTQESKPLEKTTMISSLVALGLNELTSMEDI